MSSNREVWRKQMKYLDINEWDGYKIGDYHEFTKTITQTDIVNWVGLTGDFNPLYIDSEYCKSTKFRECIVPSLLLQGFVSTTVYHLVKNSCYTEQFSKFIKPAFIGDTVTAIAQIRQKDATTKTIVIKAQCVNQKGELLLVSQQNHYILE